MAMNASSHDERRAESLGEDRGQPPIRPPFERWAAMQEPNQSWFGAVPAFLRSLNGPTLVAVLAVAGMVYIGALLARPEKEVPTPGVVGASVSVGSLAVITLMALHIEGKSRHAKNSKRGGDEPPDP
jgi:hypothetical protein